MVSEPSPNDGPPDAVLVARCLAGNDRHAFNALVRRHQGAVRALLRRLTKGDDAWADDLAQETFIQAHRKLDQFRGDARFGTWLYRVAYNIFLMAVRSRRPEESLDDEQPEAAVEDGSALQPEADAADMQMDLAQAMKCLSPAERAVIAQCYYLDRSHEEAAFALDCPVGTVKSHISRAKQKLKMYLQVWEPSTL
ncbi:MAG: sigma-70 family RNA polymerase sigma factor [Nevskia sp.]|nr:sigma-70 family RNA polymerase sigma factor [Nevskia sp.]